MKTQDWIANKLAHLAHAEQICLQNIASGKDMRPELAQIKAKMEILCEMLQ